MKISQDFRFSADSLRFTVMFPLFTFFMLFTVFFSAAPEVFAESLGEKPAKKAPDWVQNGIMYQINTRAMTPEGTVKAITEKLPVLKEAGVTILYFCPLFLADDDMRQEYWSPRQIQSGLNNPRNPYRMKDYDVIDPEYGTLEEVREFVKAAHEQGMHVIFDLVYLHCGPTAPIVTQHPEYFQKNANGSMKLTVWKFPMFDFNKPETREYFWKNMEFWIRECGIDGYRCDVSDGIPLDFWVEGRRRIEKLKPEAALLAEGQRREDQLAAFDLNYNFTFYGTVNKIFTQNAPASEARKVLESMAAERPIGARFIRYIDNHDISNDDYSLRKDARWSSAGVDAALALMFTLDGVPMLYCGQEIADLNRHSLYGSAKFGGCIIDWNRLNTPEGRARLALCGRLSEMRRSNPVFTLGTVEWLENSHPEAVLSFRRVLGEKSARVLINLKNEPVSVKIQDEEIKLAAFEFKIEE